MTLQTHTSKDLTLEVDDADGALTVNWFGKSTAREPAVFLAPILADVIARGASESRRIHLDFRQLQYMNSSTITPLIRILDDARKGGVSVTIRYDRNLKWQELSFSALRIFQTTDKRVQIVGGEG